MSSRTKVCVTVASQDLDSAVKKAERGLSMGSDLVEFRLDYLKRLDFESAAPRLRPLASRSIFTIRPKREGGFFSGAEAERLELLSRFSSLRPAFVDVEGDSLHSVSIAHGTKVIASWHFLEGTPSPRRMVSTAEKVRNEADVIKLVSKAVSVDDNLLISSVYDLSDLPLVAFCTGDAGVLSRVLSIERGAPLAYSCLPGEQVAPGQMPVSETVALRRVIQNH